MEDDIGYVQREPYELREKRAPTIRFVVESQNRLKNIGRKGQGQT